jgi:aspartate-semialdehyde dehydrogenase
MDPEKKLIVPEVNASDLSEVDKIIANPNCSTIQMVVALAPLHAAFGIKRLVISTYQSFTGTGVKAVKQYQLESKGFEPKPEEMAYHHPIFENCLPHCDVFLENEYTKEEMKLVHETRKILGDANMKITATAVRVPVDGGHSESVNVEFEKPFDLAAVKTMLATAPGIIVENDLQQNKYPMPLFAKNRDEVFVGRIRRDESIENGLNLWIVADNLRKGAATNAVQIAEFLLAQHLVGERVH